MALVNPREIPLESDITMSRICVYMNAIGANTNKCSYHLYSVYVNRDGCPQNDLINEKFSLTRYVIRSCLLFYREQVLLVFSNSGNFTNNIYFRLSKRLTEKALKIYNIIKKTGDIHRNDVFSEECFAEFADDLSENWWKLETVMVKSARNT